MGMPQHLRIFPSNEHIAVLFSLIFLFLHNGALSSRGIRKEIFQVTILMQTPKLSNSAKIKVR